MSQKVSHHQGVLYMLTSVAFFAIMNAVAKSLHHIPAHELVFFRSLIVCAISFYYVRKLNLPIAGNNRKWLFIRGISGLTALMLFFMTLKNIPLASATSLQYLSPIFTVLFAVWLNKQKVKKMQWVYFALAFCGVLCIKGFDDRISLFWLSIGIASSLIAGLAYNSIIRLRETDHPYTIVIHLTFISLPVTFIWCLFDFVFPTGFDWLALAVMGVTTQVAQFYATKAFISGKAAEVAPWNYVGAVLSLIIGYFLFNETITFLSIVGISLIVVSLILNSRLKEVSEINK